MQTQPSPAVRPDKTVHHQAMTSSNAAQTNAQSSQDDRDGLLNANTFINSLSVLHTAMCNTCINRGNNYLAVKK
jgi:hypothetical protein